MDRKELQNAFVKVFGEETGTISTYFAPGRVNLIGEHTDYNGGHVLPCALSLGIYGAFRPRKERKLRFYSLSYPQAGIIERSVDQLVNSKDNGWANYPIGMVWTFQNQGNKFDHGFDMLVYSHLPVGCGLSSSAALEVLTGFALNKMYQLDKSLAQIAILGQYCENHFINVSCGIMDQFISALGKQGCAMFLDTNTLEYQYAPINLTDYEIIIANTNVKHNLTASAYNTRRQQCESALKQLQKVCKIKSLGDLDEQQLTHYQDAITDAVELKRAKHAVSENQRTIKAYQALCNNDLKIFGQLMNASHVSLRDDFEVSCAELDYLAEHAWMLPGILGSRMTGAGFGGCTVSLVAKAAQVDFITFLGHNYEQTFGRKAEFYIVEAGSGAREVE